MILTTFSFSFEHENSEDPALEIKKNRDFEDTPFYRKIFDYQIASVFFFFLFFQFFFFFNFQSCSLESLKWQQRRLHT